MSSECLRGVTLRASTKRGSPTLYVREGGQRCFYKKIFAGKRKNCARGGPNTRGRKEGGVALRLIYIRVWVTDQVRSTYICNLFFGKQGFNTRIDRDTGCVRAVSCV